MATSLYRMRDKLKKHVTIKRLRKVLCAHSTHSSNFTAVKMAFTLQKMIKRNVH